MHIFKSFNLEKSTQNEKVSFIKENELNVTQVELLSFLIFKNVQSKGTLIHAKKYLQDFMSECLILFYILKF